MNYLTTTAKPDVRKVLHMEDSDGNWLPPAKVEDWHRAQARAILADYAERKAMEPATQDAIAEWLMSLGTLCAAKMTVDDARLRIAAYGTMMAGDFEAGCFTKGSLKRVAPQFTWFPSYAEVYAALKLEKVRLWKERYRLQKLAEPPQKETPRPEPTAEQRERVAQAIKDAGFGEVVQ